jgi:hypothetical protein
MFRRIAKLEVYEYDEMCMAASLEHQSMLVISRFVWRIVYVGVCVTSVSIIDVARVANRITPPTTSQ